MWELDYKEYRVPKNYAFELWCWRRLLTSPLDCKEIQPVHPKGDQSWVFFGRNDAKAEISVLWPPHVKSWKKLWCWEGLGAKGEGDDRGWDGWIASPTRWTWVWVNSWSWWWTGRLGVLWFMGLQRVRSDWTKLNWNDLFQLTWKFSGLITEIPCPRKFASAMGKLGQSFTSLFHLPTSSLTY